MQCSVFIATSLDGFIARADGSLQKGAVFETMSGAPADIASRLAARGLRHAYVDGGGGA